MSAAVAQRQRPPVDSSGLLCPQTLDLHLQLQGLVDADPCAMYMCRLSQAITPEEREYSEALFAPPPPMAELQGAVAGGGKGGVGAGMRVACVDFSGLAVGLPHGASSVPSIQSATVIMTGAAAFGLEGMGLRELPPDLANAMAARMGGIDPRSRPISNTNVKGGALGSARVQGPAQGLGVAGAKTGSAAPGGAGPSASPSRRQAIAARNYGRGGYM